MALSIISQLSTSKARQLEAVGVDLGSVRVLAHTIGADGRQRSG
jgi:hypothetical protein